MTEADYEAISKMLVTVESAVPVAVKPRRRVRITQITKLMTSEWFYTNELPDWFKPMQYIFEDDSFYEMNIRLGDGNVEYHVMIEPEMMGE